MPHPADRALWQRVMLLSRLIARARTVRRREALGDERALLQATLLRRQRERHA